MDQSPDIIHDTSDHTEDEEEELVIGPDEMIIYEDEQGNYYNEQGVYLEKKKHFKDIMAKFQQAPDNQASKLSQQISKNQNPKGSFEGGVPSYFTRKIVLKSEFIENPDKQGLTPQKQPSQEILTAENRKSRFGKSNEQNELKKSIITEDDEGNVVIDHDSDSAEEVDLGEDFSPATPLRSYEIEEQKVQLLPTQLFSQTDGKPQKPHQPYYRDQWVPRLVPQSSTIRPIVGHKDSVMSIKHYRASGTSDTFFRGSYPNMIVHKDSNVTESVLDRSVLTDSVLSARPSKDLRNSTAPFQDLELKETAKKDSKQSKRPTGKMDTKKKGNQKSEKDDNDEGRFCKMCRIQ